MAHLRRQQPVPGCGYSQLAGMLLSAISMAMVISMHSRRKRSLSTQPHVDTYQGGDQGGVAGNFTDSGQALGRLL